MNTKFLKKLRTQLVIITTLFFAAQTPVWAWYGSEQIVENLLAETYIGLKINATPGKHAQTPTLAYLDRSMLHTDLNINYDDRIKNIGTDYFKKLFTRVITNECKFKDNYRVFYHAQKREFALFQDLYNGLYKIANKKTLSDFILLRTPDTNYSKFKNINDFLHYYIKTGDIKDKHFNYISSDIKKRLLSVNPSLFSNTSKPNEGSFHYFLNDQSWEPIDIMNVVQDLFDSFSYSKYFVKYSKELIKLNTMLSEAENEKTGILLQIFVPEKLVNSLAYRCEICGCLYHKDEIPEKHPATIDLDDYAQNLTYCSDSSFDKCQLRLLINQTMLDPNSGIKFIRYWNQTDTVKTYKSELQKLLVKIKTDIETKAKK